MLQGGELQRFAIAVVVVQRADVYMFDEPSSYLDVKQRLKVCHNPTHLNVCIGRISFCLSPLRLFAMPQAALAIRQIVSPSEEGGMQRYVLVVEHDLAVLDYLSGAFRFYLSLPPVRPLLPHAPPPASHLLPPLTCKSLV